MEDQETEIETVIETTEETEIETPEVETEVAAEEKKKNKVTARERINQLTRQKGDINREAERLRAENEELRKSQRIEKQPDEDDFPDIAAYIAAQAKYTAQQEADRQAEIDRLADEKIAKSEAARAKEDMFSRYRTEREKAVTKYEDFEDSEELVAVLTNKHNNPAIQELIMESSNPTAVIDYLANNYQEAERIVKKSLVGAATDIASLATRLNTPKKAKVELPPPVKLGSSGSVTTDLHKMDQAAYNAYMNKR